MKCAQHVEQDAVGSCQDCQRGLCQDCIKRYAKPLCNTCLLAHLSKQNKQLYLGLFITIVFFILGYYGWVRFFQGGIFEAFIPGLLLAGLYWGWCFLSDHLARPAKKERSTMKGLLVWGSYYVFKLLLALCICIFVGPYRVYKIISGIGLAKRIKRQITGVQP